MVLILFLLFSSHPFFQFHTSTPANNTDNQKVHPTALIGPNVAISAHCQIGPGARVSHSILLVYFYFFLSFSFSFSFSLFISLFISLQNYLNIYLFVISFLYFFSLCFSKCPAHSFFFVYFLFLFYFIYNSQGLCWKRGVVSAILF